MMRLLRLLTLKNRISNNKGMELLQMVIIIAIVVALGGVIYTVLQNYFPTYVEGLMEKMTTGFGDFDMGGGGAEE